MNRAQAIEAREAEYERRHSQRFYRGFEIIVGRELINGNMWYCVYDPTWGAINDHISRDSAVAWINHQFRLAETETNAILKRVQRLKDEP